MPWAPGPLAAKHATRADIRSNSAPPWNAICAPSSSYGSKQVLKCLAKSTRCACYMLLHVVYISLSRCMSMYVFGDLHKFETPINLCNTQKIRSLFLVMSSHITISSPKIVCLSFSPPASECPGWVVEPPKSLNANWDHQPILRNNRYTNIIMNNYIYIQYIIHVKINSEQSTDAASVTHPP